MSDNSSNGNDMAARHRRSSITQAAMTNLFQRGASNASGPPFGGPGPGPANDSQRRRLSVTTLGLSGTSPTNAPPSFSMRRSSISTNSNDSIDESAVEDDEGGAIGSKTAPTTPFVRRMSFGANTAMRGGYRNGSSPGNDQSTFNWSEQLRSRAESTVTASRPSMPFSGTSGRAALHHDRAKSVSDMPQPPAQASSMRARQERQKPDAFQERILKGDFYMD